MIRVNGWWWYNGADGWMHCAGHHKIGRGWLYVGNGCTEKLYCKACAIKLLQITPPAAIDWPGWGDRSKQRTFMPRHA